MLTVVVVLQGISRLTLHNSKLTRTKATDGLFYHAAHFLKNKTKTKPLFYTFLVISVTLTCDCSRVSNEHMNKITNLWEHVSCPVLILVNLCVYICLYVICLPKLPLTNTSHVVLSSQTFKKMHVVGDGISQLSF